MAEEGVTDLDLALAIRAVTEACDSVGVSAADLRVLRFAKNAVFSARSAGLAVRVSRDASRERTGMEVAVAAAASGLPVVAPLLTTEAVIVRGCSVSFWPLHRPAGNGTDFGWLGSALRAVHEESAVVSRGVEALPSLLDQQLASVRRRIARVEELGVATTHIRWASDALEAALSDVELTESVLLHGDVHPGNVVLTDEGEFLLTDFDHAALGPPAWDLVALDVECRRFGLPRADFDRLCAGYRIDVATETAYELLVELRELKAATYAAGLRAPSQTALEELRRRIGRWEGRDVRWRVR